LSLRAASFHMEIRWESPNRLLFCPRQRRWYRTDLYLCPNGRKEAVARDTVYSGQIKRVQLVWNIATNDNGRFTGFNFPIAIDTAGVAFSERLEAVVAAKGRRFWQYAVIVNSRMHPTACWIHRFEHQFRKSCLRVGDDCHFIGFVVWPDWMF
jgi:hypothetical protein